MGRARASMQLIQKTKTRRVTGEKRGESLIKKASELSELCDVDVCLIMYPPGDEGGAAAEPPKILPENPEKIHNLIDLYNSVRADEKRCQFYDVPKYFKDRKRKTEAELDKLRKKNRETMYPSSIENLPKETMRDLGRSLTAKIGEVNRRIDEIRRVRTSSNNNFSNLLAPSPNFGHSIHQHNHQFLPINAIPANSFSQMMLEAAGASTSNALTGGYMFEQPPEQFVGNLVGRSYNNANAMAPQLCYHGGYNMALPQFAPPGMNGFAYMDREFQSFGDMFSFRVKN